jgi:hypothetical protein
MDYNTRIWNVILNGELQCNNNVDEQIARNIKDSLLAKGNNVVSIVRYENKVRYIYTYKNIKLAKQQFSEE